MLTSEEIKRFNANLERIANSMEKLVELLDKEENNKETN